MTEALQKKLHTLKGYIAKLGGAAVAFSGGVDSALLLAVSHEVLGNKVIAVTVKSDVFPDRELREAKAFCRDRGIRQYTYELDALGIEGFAKNPPDRCYLCKKQLMKGIQETARAQDIAYVLEGSNMDDLGDYRPGMQAVAELGIQSPLRAAGLCKAEIRTLSKEYGLPTWDKPSYACLASRFVHGECITKERLSMVERAEQLLITLGFRQMRVRVHGESNPLARIEVQADDMEKLLEENIREEITQRLSEYGFSYVALDLQGYRTGSMNPV